MVEPTQVVEALKFWRGYEQELVTLGMYTVGLAFYAILVALFYENLSKRDLFGAHDERPVGFWRLILRGLRYLAIFPLTSFLFFTVLTAALFFLSKSQTAAQIMLISMSVVAGVRATAYLSHSASTDLAKLVPLGLLGVFLVDPGYLDIHTTIGRFKELWTLRFLVLRYLVVLVLLEVTLRLVYLAGTAGRRRGMQRLPVKEAPPIDAGTIRK